MIPFRKFDKRVNDIKTMALINNKWYAVKEVHETRQWIKVRGLVGSFQVGHVTKFTNKQI